jgi:streptogramin lyase
VKVDAVTKKVTTVAGYGSYGFSGDGGPATAAQFATPWSMTFDAAGNLYFTDEYRVRKIDATTGIISTVVGNGEYIFCGEAVPARSACLSIAYGIDVDGQGNVVFTGDAINRLRQVSPSTGLVTTVGQLSPLNNTSGMGVEHDAAGNFYVPSWFSYTVFRIDAVTHAVTKFAGNGAWPQLAGDGGPATLAKFDTPTDIAFDTAGNAYISDTGNARIRRVDAATGIITTYAGTFKGFAGDGGPATSARLDSVTIVEFDPAGNLVLSDGWNCRLRRIDKTTGIITTIAGNGTCTTGAPGDGGPATAASIGSYTGFAFDPSGNLYLAYSNNLRRIDATTGIITTIPPPTAAGWKTPEGPAMTNPWALEFDAQGNLYVGDRLQHVIFRISGLP